MKNKYTRSSALAILSRNGVQIQVVKNTPVPTAANPYPESRNFHYIPTRELGIKLQGVADYLINNFYDIFRK